MIKNIVILGAGFGGISATKHLIGKTPDNFKIILVDKNPYHIFQSSLYEIATASLGKRYPRRIDFKNLYTTAILDIKKIFKANKYFDFVQATVNDINLKERKIILENKNTLDFDYLVFALGSETNFFGIPGAEEMALPLKNINDALNIRNAVQEVFERKQSTQRIIIIIGGGGFTGCEFASELVFYLRKLSTELGHVKERVEVKVIEAADTILPGAADWVKKAALKRMKKIGIEFFFGKQISGIKDSTILLKTGEKLYCDVFIWTAGIKANSLVERINGIKLEKGCRILSDDCLRIVPYRNIFGVGDNLYCFDSVLQTPMPATAWMAIKQGKIVAKNILNDIYGKKAIKCKSMMPRLVIPLGGKWGIVDAGPLKLKGFLGWLTKEVIILKYYVSVLPFLYALILWLKGIKIYIRND
ncbi:NAD(P)/FAD-dependent oxidoreductase [Patescibacteria group bacterium]|nr:NAD(P)/FAD-dependent oxidoreductase [Patescibacteria group bacterium]